MGAWRVAPTPGTEGFQCPTSRSPEARPTFEFQAKSYRDIEIDREEQVLYTPTNIFEARARSHL